MSPLPPDHVQDLQEGILRYLADHPDAADTCEGIEAWWLGGGLGDACGDELRLALEALIRRRVLMREILPGGAVIYRGAQAQDVARIEPERQP
jgi:hypothetical protein